MGALIVCVGNRLVPEDALGPAVHDHLARRALPPGVDLLDGGLRGMGLLSEVERAEHVVFVDSVHGGAGPGELVEIDDGAAAEIEPAALGHDTGLAYLLAALPHVVEGTPPRWQLVGAAGAPRDTLVEAVAARAIALAATPPGGRP